MKGGGGNYQQKVDFSQEEGSIKVGKVDKRKERGEKIAHNGLRSTVNGPQSGESSKSRKRKILFTFSLFMDLSFRFMEPEALCHRTQVYDN